MDANIRLIGVKYLYPVNVPERDALVMEDILGITMAVEQIIERCIRHIAWEQVGRGCLSWVKVNGGLDYSPA